MSLRAIAWQSHRIHLKHDEIARSLAGARVSRVPYKIVPAELAHATRVRQREEFKCIKEKATFTDGLFYISK